MSIQDHYNKEDVAMYVKHRLKDIMIMWGLPVEWPQKDRTELFIKKADGLFIWAATMSEYLVHQVSPGKHLDFLLSGTGQSESHMENQMNKLYSTILSTCNWDDGGFVEGYGLLIGAILAAKIPFCICAPIYTFSHFDGLSHQYLVTACVSSNWTGRSSMAYLDSSPFFPGLPHNPYSVLTWQCTVLHKWTSA